MIYPAVDSRSRDLHRRARRVMPGGNTRTTVYMDPYPIYAVRGEGCRVWDADGVARIDCINNFTALIHGHAHPAIVAAIAAQASSGTSFGLPTESEIDLAELLVDRVPGIEQVRFMNSGTEAVMMALKAARAATGRPAIAKVEGAYHGAYDYAEVSLDSAPGGWGEPSPASNAYSRGTPAGVLDDVVVLPFNDLRLAERLLREHAGRLAALLVDPMPNRAGLVPAEPAYLEGLRRITRELGILLVFDEVITLRLGPGGAQALWNIEPDLTVLGKIIGGGFPVGAVGGHTGVMAVFDPSRGKPAVPHGGTFSANPMTMRAGLAAMQLLTPEAFARLERMGDELRRAISADFARLGLPGQAVGRGSLLKVHFTNRPLRDYRSAFPSAEEARRAAVFHRGLLNRGVLAAGYGLMALSTPMTDADLEEIMIACRGALDSIIST